MAKDQPEVVSAAGGLAAIDADAMADAKDAGIKIPADLSKVSPQKAKELAEAGLVSDQDLPGKMYKRKADGFVARIPTYTFEAYGSDLKAEWDEIKLNDGGLRGGAPVAGLIASTA